MLNEIKDIYLKQSSLYLKIIESLNSIVLESIDSDKYLIELENINFMLCKINELNNRVEQLKIIYITKNNLKDFVGEEIKKVENIEDYNEFKAVIDNLSKLILSTKKLNDEIQIKVQRNMNKIKLLRKRGKYSLTSKDFILPFKEVSGQKLDRKK